MEDFRAPPEAAALIESMRDIGYSFETALADIIDNSITAGAGTVDVLCDASRMDPVIAILDDGCGMSLSELLDAMRPGSANPLDSRREGDLGRFGLGLKTASFSQCRRLTVVTRKDGHTAAARWDLDYVADKNDWLIQVPGPEDICGIPFLDRLSAQGTLILWEKLDRLSEETRGTSLKEHLYDRLDVARKHLELVFHRFLAGERPLPKIDIRINNRSISAFDPFHTTHPATQRQPAEKIPIAGVTVHVQPFVLPHHKKVSRSDWEKYSGEGGYLKNQGFYVYRSGRLIIHGTWFRLLPQSELTKLARVQVDMPVELDYLWKIDVKKASAAPPLVVRQRLRAIIDRIGGASNRVYTGRGTKISNPGLTPIWARRANKNQIYYELNREHPTIAGLMGSLNEFSAAQLELLLGVIEKSFPVDALFSDVASKPDMVDAGDVDHGALEELVRLTVGFLRESRLSDEKILETLQRADPYRSNWEVAEPMVRYSLELS